MNQLIDIYTPVVIKDYSLYLFLFILVVGFFLGLFLFKKAFAYGKKNCKINCYKYFLEKFSSINWSNPKEAAYKATYYGRFLANDARKKDIFLQMKSHLDKYKYKKEVASIDQEAINYYNLFKQVCDESH